MRTLLPLAAVLLTAPLALHSQTMPVLTASVRDTTITVNVTRVGRSAADRASFYIGVEAVAETTPLAVDRVQAKLKAVTDSVKRVSPSTILEIPILVSAGATQATSYPPPPGPLYVARGAVRVTVTKLTDLPLLQVSTTAAGATTTGGLTYESTTAEALWKSKSAEALTAARATAEASADSQGYKLGRLLNMNVSGGPQNNGFSNSLQLNFDARNTYTQMSSPETQVNATVSVTYLLTRK